MKNKYGLFLSIATTVLLIGCVSTPVKKSQTYPLLYAERPKSIMILPPINKSVNVEAKEQFYSSLIVPLTLNGYYVLPPLLAIDILKEESAYDTENFIGNSMKPVGALFGVDAVLFTTIHNWDKTSLLNRIVIKVEYMLKSTKTDSILFHRIGEITYSTQLNSGNVWVDLVGQMLITSMQKEIIIGRKCNMFTLADIPNGIYSPSFQVDSVSPAGNKEFRATIANQ